jgi:hypothetical protein
VGRIVEMRLARMIVPAGVAVIPAMAFMRVLVTVALPACLVLVVGVTALFMFVRSPFMGVTTPSLMLVLARLRLRFCLVLRMAVTALIAARVPVLVIVPAVLVIVPALAFVVFTLIRHNFPDA